MSSILKALKKLEEEKALRRDEALDLPREILISRRDKRSFAPFRWGAAIILTILVTICITALVMTRRTGEQASRVTGGPTAGSTPGDRLQPVPERLETAIIRAAPKKPPAQQAVEQMPPYQLNQQPLANTAAKVRTEERPVTRNLPSLPETAPLPPTAHLLKTTPAKISEPAEGAIAVSGIAWNKDSADRIAIINGQPTATGTYINGFIVEEILPDRVRFSAAGKMIEIPIGKSGNLN